MKTLTTIMSICKKPACGLLATFAIMTAFAFGSPAQAGDNEFSEWLCGGVSGCHSGGDRGPRGLLGELELSFDGDIFSCPSQRWTADGGCLPGDGLIEDLPITESIAALALPTVEFGFITPAHAGEHASEDFQCIFSPVTGKDCYCNGTCGVLDGVGLITPVPDDLPGSMSVITPALAGDTFWCNVESNWTGRDDCYS